MSCDKFFTCTRNTTRRTDTPHTLSAGPAAVCYGTKIKLVLEGPKTKTRSRKKLEHDVEDEDDDDMGRCFIISY